jgi:hypothetical protein
VVLLHLLELVVMQEFVQTVWSKQTAQELGIMVKRAQIPLFKVIVLQF